MTVKSHYHYHCHCHLAEVDQTKTGCFPDTLYLAACQPVSDLNGRKPIR